MGPAVVASARAVGFASRARWLARGRSMSRQQVGARARPRRANDGDDAARGVRKRHCGCHCCRRGWHRRGRDAAGVGDAAIRLRREGVRGRRRRRQTAHPVVGIDDAAQTAAHGEGWIQSTRIHVHGGIFNGEGDSANSLLKDTASMDTIGNAYYSLCLHAIPRGWARVEVVTSAFHMARTRAAFEWVWGLSPLGALDVRFVSTEDAGIDPSGLRARAEREAQSVAALKDNASRVTTLTEFNEWLFTTHKCYAVSRQHEIGVFDELSEEARKSY